MLSEKPPIRILAPGKVFRCDSDATHSPVFHQMEGLYVDKSVTFSDLKGTLTFFLNELFGSTKNIRFRPSYFPFTEPSTEVDVTCMKCDGRGCSLCKHTGWLEILGAGLVNRNVFRSVDINPDEYRGFAFGMGIERIAMLRYEIPDIKLFYENNLQFIRQF
jgi:phenylalanyl-tRNA synthetase alpha chain